MVAEEARARYLRGDAGISLDDGEERGHCLGIFLGPSHQMQQHAAALNRIAPGRQNWLAPGARTQPLGDAEVRSPEVAQLATKQ